MVLSMYLKPIEQLKQAGYDLEYYEFNGLHTIPSAIAERAIEWFTQSAPDKRNLE